jgi:transcriptional regulator with XRE-family HTH domain
MNVLINTDVIRAKLIELDWSQEKLAKAAGLTKRGIETILKRGTASLDSLHRIAKALKVHVKEICPQLSPMTKDVPESLTSIEIDPWPNRFDSPYHKTGSDFSCYLKRLGESDPEGLKQLEQGLRIGLAPSCALGGAPVIELRITWDEQNKRFLVQSKFFLDNSTGEQFDVLKYLRIDVSEHSTCSCGSKLKLANHYFARNHKGAIDFLGEYLCSNCKEAKPALLEDLQRFAASHWLTAWEQTLTDGIKPNETP